MSTRHPLIAVLALAAAVSCRPDDQRTDTLNPHEGMQERESMAPDVLAQLDSGTAAYRADDFESALRHYRLVTELDDEVGAGWFGVYMAEHALGNTEEAQVALERARGIAPGATMLHEGDTAR
jgi:Flp pilus assembly protein TadD